jgi:hypothetical protein
MTSESKSVGSRQHRVDAVLQVGEAVPESLEVGLLLGLVDTRLLDVAFRGAAEGPVVDEFDGDPVLAGRSPYGP